MELETVKIKNPEELNIIIGQSHFIKTAEDIYEAMVNAVPGIKFGVAFCEASMDRLVRVEGTDVELKKLAAENALAIGAGHCFFVVMRDAFPINVLRAIKQVPEVCSIFCATANPVQVIIAKNEQGRGILGAIDGQPPLGIEGLEDEQKRKEFLRNIGYSGDSMTYFKTWQIDEQGNIREIPFLATEPSKEDNKDNVYAISPYYTGMFTKKIKNFEVTIFNWKPRNKESEKQLAQLIRVVILKDFDSELIEKSGGIEALMADLVWFEWW